MVRLVCLLALLLSACRTTKAPTLVVDFQGDKIAEPERIIEGVRRWEPFGFVVVVGRDQTSLEACPVDWYSQKVYDCKIVLTILDDRCKQSFPKAWGMSYLEERAFWVREDALGPDRVRVAAHEAGHVIMNSVAHAMDDMATMSSPPTHAITATDRHLMERLVGWPWR